MAEIRFREIKELLQDGLLQGQGLLREDVRKNKGLTDEEKVIAALSIPLQLGDDACEIIFGISDTEDESLSFAFAYLDEVLYVRIFDGEKYLFPLPFMLTESADSVSACINLAAYTVREMIPLLITDVPRDELEFLSSVFPHIDARCYDDDEDSFFVKVNNECDMLDELPTMELDGVILDAIRPEDKEEYAELCRDRELNKYWGYDVDVDNPEADADFYIRVAQREFFDGVAITLAIRENSQFVGEASIYGFDYRGGASIAVRVLPSCHSRGLGSRAVRALIALASRIGLSELSAEILKDNATSVKMTSKFMKLKYDDGSKCFFTLSL